jgi:cytochrome c
MKRNTQLSLRLLGAALLAAATSACAPVSGTQTVAGSGYDAEAAKAMALKDSCLRCHGLNKQKEGPIYSAVAKKYYGNPNAEARLYEHLTTGEAAKMSDGHIEFHKSISDQNPKEIRNLVRWILAQ